MGGVGGGARPTWPGPHWHASATCTSSVLALSRGAGEHAIASSWRGSTIGSAIREAMGRPSPPPVLVASRELAASSSISRLCAPSMKRMRARRRRRSHTTTLSRSRAAAAPRPPAAAVAEVVPLPCAASADSVAAAGGGGGGGGGARSGKEPPGRVHTVRSELLMKPASHGAHVAFALASVSP